MNLELIKDYRESPLLIFDYGEPKQIMFHVVDETDNEVCELDLWETATSSLSISDQHFSEYDRILTFPRESFDGTEIVIAHEVEGPVYLSKCKSELGDEYLVFYSVYEYQPSRYMCYVLAILRDRQN